MSRLKSRRKPLVTRAIRLDEAVSDWFVNNEINMSLVCRDLLFHFMNQKTIPEKYYYTRACGFRERAKNIKLKVKNYEN